MVEFKPKDFESLLYHVHTVKKSMDIFEAFPELLDYSEFTLKTPASLPINKVLPYIIYVYDKKSPYVTQIDDLKERKIQAARDVGFRTTHQKGFSESAIKMLNCEYDNINSMIIRYLRLQGKDVTGLAVDQEAYYQINLQIIKGIEKTDDDKNKTAKDKAALSKVAGEMRTRLEEDSRNFLEGETAIKLQEKLWDLAENEAEHIKLTPEDYAEEVQES
jgi:hypothetical protein